MNVWLRYGLEMLILICSSCFMSIALEDYEEIFGKYKVFLVLGFLSLILCVILNLLGGPLI